MNGGVRGFFFYKPCPLLGESLLNPSADRNYDDLRTFPYTPGVILANLKQEGNMKQKSTWEEIISGLVLVNLLPLTCPRLHNGDREKGRTCRGQETQAGKYFFLDDVLIPKELNTELSKSFFYETPNLKNWLGWFFQMAARYRTSDEISSTIIWLKITGSWSTVLEQKSLTLISRS